MSRRASGAPAIADLRRLRAARRQARAEVAAAEALRAGGRRDAFRRELVATVRCASPFLLALLEAEGMTLGSVVRQMSPAFGWPERPRLYRVVTSWLFGPRAVRQAIASLEFDPPQREADLLPGFGSRLSGGGWAHVRIMGHSVEVGATIGAARFETQFGELTITLRDRLPEVIVAACVGRLVDEVAAHALTSGRGWRVVEAHVFAFGTSFTIETGSVPCHLDGIVWGRE